MFLVHIKAGDPFVAGPKGGRSYELAAVYLCAALGILLTGPGRLSIDALLFGKKPPSA
jgi:putative oxidoreductase